MVYRGSVRLEKGGSGYYGPLQLEPYWKTDFEKLPKAFQDARKATESLTELGQGWRTEAVWVDPDGDDFAQVKFILFASNPPLKQESQTISRKKTISVSSLDIERIFPGQGNVHPIIERVQGTIRGFEFAHLGTPRIEPFYPLQEAHNSEFPLYYVESVQAFPYLLRAARLLRIVEATDLNRIIVVVNLRQIITKQNQLVNPFLST